MKQRKIFYVPGMISLVVLPLVFICWINKSEPEEEVTLRMWIPKNEPNFNPNKIESFSEEGVLESIKSFKKTEIYLSRFESELLEYQIDFSIQELKRIAFTHQSKEVLIVHISDNVSFYQFVEFINYTHIVSLKRWAFFKGAFYFLGNEPPQPLTTNYEPIIIEPMIVEPLICGYSDYIPPQQEPHYWQNTKDKILELKQNKGLWIVLAYILLSGMVTYKFIRKNKTV